MSASDCTTPLLPFKPAHKRPGRKPTTTVRYVSKGKPRPGIYRTCEGCHREFIANLYDVRRGFGRYCSVQCGTLSENRNHEPPRIIPSPGTDAEKYAAWTALNEAIRVGAIVRPDKCEECGMRVRPDAHHDDYSKPYDVRWLCRSCHMGHHAAHSPLAHSA